MLLLRLRQRWLVVLVLVVAVVVRPPPIGCLHVQRQGCGCWVEREAGGQGAQQLAQQQRPEQQLCAAATHACREEGKGSHAVGGSLCKHCTEKRGWGLQSIIITHGWGNGVCCASGVGASVGSSRSTQSVVQVQGKGMWAPTWPHFLYFLLTAHCVHERLA